MNEYDRLISWTQSCALAETKVSLKMDLGYTQTMICCNLTEGGGGGWD